MHFHPVNPTTFSEFFLINSLIKESSKGIVDFKRAPHHHLVQGMKILLANGLELEIAFNRHPLLSHSANDSAKSSHAYGLQTNTHGRSLQRRDRGFSRLVAKSIPIHSSADYQPVGSNQDTRIPSWKNSVSCFSHGERLL